MFGLWGNLLTLLILIAIVVGLLYLAKRAFGSQNGLVKWGGGILAVLGAVLVALVAIVGGLGMSRMYLPRSNPPSQISVAGTPEQIARGKELAYFCTGCHSSSGELPLDGGAINFGNLPGAPPMGELYPPNLTPGGPLKNWTDGEIVRAFREGVHQNGRSLVIMPSESFHNLSDEDAASLVAFLRSQPAVPDKTPEFSPNFVAALVLGTGTYPPSAQVPITQPIVSPPEGPTAAYGKYLVSISDCLICHGSNLAGGDGTRAFTPIGPNLTAIVPGYTAEQFIAVFRTGINPMGHQLDNDLMPWKDFSKALTDDDLRAIHEHIKSLPVAPTN